MLNLKPRSELTFNFSARILLQALEDARPPGYLEAATYLNTGCGVMHYSPAR